MLLFYLIQVLGFQIFSEGSIRLKFTDKYGLDVKNPSAMSSFNILATFDDLKILFRVKNHSYFTELDFFQDPCFYFIKGFFTNSRGFINLCEEKMEFAYRNHRYTINYNKEAQRRVFNYERPITVKYQKDKIIPGDERRYERILKWNGIRGQDFEPDWGIKSKGIGKKIDNINIGNKDMNAKQSNNAIAGDDKGHNKNIEDHNKNKIDRPKEEKSLDIKEASQYGMKDPKATKQKSYALKVFIINNNRRVESQGTNIGIKTLSLFNKTKEFFNDTSVEPELTGILNLRENINMDTEKTILENLKSEIDTVRFSPYNLSLELNKANIIVLINEGSDLPVMEEGEKYLQVHGMTYQGGSVRLDSSYSVVMTNPNETEYFIAKKIAHEIGHSLGLEHDNVHGFLMEQNSCLECKNQTREFTKSSVKQINEFVEKHKRVFIKKMEYKYRDDQIIYTLQEAAEFATERRRHSLYEIIKERLSGNIPMAGDYSSFHNLSLILYISGIYLAVRYFKHL